MDKKNSSSSDTKKIIKELEKQSIKKLLENLSSNDATLKYQSSKMLMYLSEGDSQKVYPYFDEFVKLFDSDNNIIKWTGVIITGNLAKIDSKKKIDKIMDKLFHLLNVGEMITAGNTIVSLAKIALAKPDWRQKITVELLKVKNYKYDSAECGNIAVGHVIEGFDLYLKNPDKKVIDFITRQTKNSRNATAKKAEKYLKKVRKTLK